MGIFLTVALYLFKAYLSLHVIIPLVLLVLRLISVSPKSVIKEIYNLEEIDDNKKAMAVLCMKEAKRLDLKTLFYDCTAPVVTFYVLMFTKRDATVLPEFFKRWNNNVSINGDGHWVRRGDVVFDLRTISWEEFNPETDVLIPYDSEEQLGNAYYCKWFKPKDFLARWVFIGVRNRASWYSRSLGPYIPSRPTLLLGDLNLTKHNPGKFLIQHGNNFHYKSIKKVGCFYIIRSYGMKLEYAMKWNDDFHDTVPATAIGFSFKVSFK